MNQYPGDGGRQAVRERETIHKLVRLFRNDISNGTTLNRLIDKIKQTNAVALLIMVNRQLNNACAL